jgi:hypothetical protein
LRAEKEETKALPAMTAEVIEVPEPGDPVAAAPASNHQELVKIMDPGANGEADSLTHRLEEKPVNIDRNEGALRRRQDQ